MSKVAVILSGCGVFDGAEIYETVFTLLRLEQAGVEYQCMAPDIEQQEVIDHRSGEVAAGERRNVLTEAARLARGRIIDLAEADPADYDALIIPGGFGAAKNLSDFARAGIHAQVHPQVSGFVQAVHAAQKPIGLICIAPALAPVLFGRGVQCTIGHAEDVAGAINEMGGEHHACPVTDIVFDEANKLVSTPAYMLAQSMTEAQTGINKLVDQVLKLA